MKNTLKICHKTGVIVMDATFAKKSENTMSAEYAHLQQVRRDYPTYKVIRRTIKRNANKKTSVDYVIVHSNEEETQIQVRGRVNSDLPCLYLPNNDPTALTVPDDFLNRPLFREDTDKLCEILNQKNECGRRYAWRKPLKEQLIECGYSIADGRKNNRRYSLITQFE